MTSGVTQIEEIDENFKLIFSKIYDGTKNYDQNFWFDKKLVIDNLLIQLYVMIPFRIIKKH